MTNCTQIGKLQWESTLVELTRLAQKFPSRRIYQQLAECYQRLGEKDEAAIMLDLARHYAGRSEPASTTIRLL